MLLAPSYYLQSSIFVCFINNFTGLFSFSCIICRLPFDFCCNLLYTLFYCVLFYRLFCVIYMYCDLSCYLVYRPQDWIIVNWTELNFHKFCTVDGLRIACATDSRAGRQHSAAHLPCHRRRSSDVRRQRVARSHQSARRQAHRLCAGSRMAPRVLPARPADVRRAV